MANDAQHPDPDLLTPSWGPIRTNGYQQVSLPPGGLPLLARHPEIDYNLPGWAAAVAVRSIDFDGQLRPSHAAIDAIVSVNVKGDGDGYIDIEGKDPVRSVLRFGETYPNHFPDDPIPHSVADIRAAQNKLLPGPDAAHWRPDAQPGHITVPTGSLFPTAYEPPQLPPEVDAYPPGVTEHWQLGQ
jgi:hypothetical protein